MSDLERQKQTILDYKTLFGAETGKRVLEDLEKRCFYNVPTFSTDALTMARQEGMRAVFLHIKTMLSLDVNKMDQLQKENDNAGQS